MVAETTNVERSFANYRRENERERGRLSVESKSERKKWEESVSKKERRG